MELGHILWISFVQKKRLVIEVDGDTHATVAQRTKDRAREEYLRSLGLQGVRYTNDEVLSNLDGVLEDLTRRLLEDSTSPFPLLTKEGTSLDHSSPLPREFYDRPHIEGGESTVG